MDSEAPVFKSDDIKNTKSREERETFVKTRGKNLSERLQESREKREKREKDRKEKEKIRKKLNYPSLITTLIKKYRLPALIFLGAVAVVILGIVFLPPLFNRLAEEKETNRYVEKTEGYIEAFNKKKNSIKTSDPDEPDEEPEFEGEDFEAIYNELTEFLNSDEAKGNDEKDLKLANSLMNLVRTIHSETIYDEALLTLKNLYPKLESEEKKAELYLLVAELHFILNQKVEAYKYFAVATSIKPELGTLDYYNELPGTFMDMLIYCQGRAEE